MAENIKAKYKVLNETTGQYEQVDLETSAEQVRGLEDELNAKANTADVYAKDEVDTHLAEKVDKSEIAIFAKLDGSNVTTPAANDNSTKIATTAWVEAFLGTKNNYNKAWKDDKLGLRLYVYEGANANALNLPSTSCFVLKMQDSGHAGVALAFEWSKYEARYMWINKCHDGWQGWVQLH